MGKTKDLIIVESPTKAKTITKFLGNGFEVTSSFGHIRDLPKGKMGIDIANNFKPEYTVPKDKSKIVSELKKKAKNANIIYFATDEDREGEAISWHLANLLNIKLDNTKRIVFHEITKTAIEEALKNPKNIDQNLVDAQQARRILDRLVGYELSPFLWKKVAVGLSAGRVQSVTVRLIVEKEREIEKFITEEYWTIEADLRCKHEALTAKLTKKDNKTLDKFWLPNEKMAQTIVKELEQAEFIVKDINSKDILKKPYAPFTTSTLQQAANNILGFSAKQTMVVAQQLYEGIKLGTQGETGLITYMRTDSLNLANKFLNEAENYIKNTFGKEFSHRTAYKTKSKGAQEAHEAIRPTEADLEPDSIKKHLKDNQYKLYKLIWQRSMASQMSNAKIKQTSIDIDAKNYLFKSTGSIISFPGWLKIYPDKVQENTLPEVSKAEKLDLLKIKPEQHFTQPPARYTEASLVKALEEKGIGRPSTYAPTISTIIDRNYVEKEEKKLKPTDIGKVVNDLLVKHFTKVVDYEFTANIEQDFDQIAEGEFAWQKILNDFYPSFHANITEKEESLKKEDILSMRKLGDDPKTGKPVFARIGRYGPFVQLGSKDDEEKPKFASLQKDQTVDGISLKEALELLTLPRILGKDDEEQEIKANIGRFGPYLQIGKKYISLKEDDPYTITADRAQEIVKEYKETEKKNLIRTFADSDIIVKIGRYGPFITDGKTNAKIPKDTKPESLSLKQCQELIEESAKKPKRKPRKFK